MTEYYSFEKLIATSNEKVALMAVPVEDAHYHQLFHKWLDQNRNSLAAIARRIGVETIHVLDDVLEEGLFEMDARANQIEEES